MENRDRTTITIENRIKGSMLGLAVGDALGTTLETLHDGFTPLTDIIGGGKYNLLAGQWTDDTSMALGLSSSLILNKGAFRPDDQLRTYLKWYREGHLGSNGQCFDIGITVRTAVLEFEKSPDRTTTVDQARAGNGSLMRLAPVPLLYHAVPDLDLAIVLSAKSSLTTHGSVLAVDACRYFAALLIGILQGASKETVLGPLYSPIPNYWEAHPLAPEIELIAKGSFKSKNPPDIQTSGYVVHSLESVLWAFHAYDTFAAGCLALVNLGGDADTTGAIYGQIAGLYYGLDGIPQSWRDKIFFRELILAMASEICALSAVVKDEKGIESSLELPSKEYKILWESFLQMEAIHSSILKKVLPGPNSYKSVADFESDMATLKAKYVNDAEGDKGAEWRMYFWNELVRIAAQEKEQVAQRTSRKPMVLPFGKK